MNSYEIKVIVSVIAQNDEDAIEKTAMAIIEDGDVEVGDIQIMSSEEYS